jgi:orotate phosphoribosyltransferase
MNNLLAKQIAEQLLQIKAIKLEPTNHFTWASGWYSPIYCDNRKTLSYPAVRNFIRDGFLQIIADKFTDVDVIAGVATGAIAQGALVAQSLGKPYIYVRPKPKEHGLGNQIEGFVERGKKVLVIEDLISTGGSSLGAVEALRKHGCEVVGMLAIFTYGFEKAANNFDKADVNLITLSNYQALLEIASETGFISSNDIKLLEEWRKDPASWKK